MRSRGGKENRFHFLFLKHEGSLARARDIYGRSVTSEQQYQMHTHTHARARKHADKLKLMLTSGLIIQVRVHTHAL